MGSIVHERREDRPRQVSSARESVITEGKQFPEHSLIIGAPARVIRNARARAGSRRMAGCREILRRQRAAIFQKRS